jgi:hypothetical protein
VLTLRRRHPRWGARKLLVTLTRQHPQVACPSRSTVCDLLRRQGVIVPRRRREAVPHGGHALAPITRPNETWTTDLKGKFRTGDCAYCYPLTLRDGFRRYVLRRDALPTAVVFSPGRASNARSRSLACPIGSRAITGSRLPAPAWAGSRASTPGGYGSGLSRNGLLWAARAEWLARTMSCRQARDGGK